MIWNYQIYYPSDMTLPKSKQSVWMKQISTYRALNITHYAVWFAQIIEYMNFTFIFFTAERKKDIFTDHFPESVKQWVMTIYNKKSHKHTNELMGAHACARVHTHTAKKQQKHDSNNSHTNITYIHTHTHTHACQHTNKVEAENVPDNKFTTTHADTSNNTSMGSYCTTDQKKMTEHLYAAVDNTYHLI